MPRACVVVPTRNEAKLIGQVIAEIRQAMAQTRYDDLVILVVDDSTDGTKAAAAAAGAVVIRGDGEGLGSAMFRGLKSALNWRPDVIVSVDGDGQADPAEIPDFLEPIDAKKADMVLGSRFARADLIDYQYRWRNRAGVKLLVGILRSYTGLPLTDSHGGIRAMRPEVVDDLTMIGTHTYVQETIIDAAEKGYRVAEIPSAWRKRQHGKSRVVGSIPTYIAYTWPILFLRSGNHIRWLYSGGLILVALAFLFFLGVAGQEGFSLKNMGGRTPAFILIALLVITGVQMFFFGFVLQLLKQMNKNLGRLGRREPGPPEE